MNEEVVQENNVPPSEITENETKSNSERTGELIEVNSPTTMGCSCSPIDYSDYFLGIIAIVTFLTGIVLVSLFAKGFKT